MKCTADMSDPMSNGVTIIPYRSVMVLLIYFILNSFTIKGCCMVIVFNVTFNNSSVIQWRSVLLLEEIGVPGENHQPAARHCQTSSHKVVSSTPRHERDFNS